MTVNCSSVLADGSDSPFTPTVLPPGVESISEFLVGKDPEISLRLRALNGFHGNYVQVTGEYVEINYLLLSPEGSADFSVTGWTDSFFTGDHSLDVDLLPFLQFYDVNLSNAGFVPQFSSPLFSGTVSEFHFQANHPDAFYYSVGVENNLPENQGDTDFFRFTGLTPFSLFEATTVLQVNHPFSLDDSRIGWYDNTGSLIDDDDDGGLGMMSRLGVTADANGEIVLGVTAGEDEYFIGEHFQQGQYQLVLTPVLPLTGDYNGDGIVALDDYSIWTSTFGQIDIAAQGLPADGNRDGIVNAADYTIWRDAYESVLSQSSAVPEPSSLALLGCLVVAGCSVSRCCREGQIA